MRIAVLDDNPAIGEMLQHSLQLAGHAVTLYPDSSQFLAAFYVEEAKTASAPFDALLVDIYFGEEISGVQIVHQVKKTFPDLPIILLLAGSSWEVEAARRASPTVKVLRKPFKMAALLAMLQELST